MNNITRLSEMDSRWYILDYILTTYISQEVNTVRSYSMRWLTNASVSLMSA